MPNTLPNPTYDTVISELIRHALVSKALTDCVLEVDYILISELRYLGFEDGRAINDHILSTTLSFFPEDLTLSISSLISSGLLVIEPSFFLQSSPSAIKDFNGEMAKMILDSRTGYVEKDVMGYC